ncbi:MAG: hypothetical protein JWN25_3439 [Verrucomicrobiales bacterium]|nr:hypothetical protein [Verrucomicrobiales bacterium]
MSLKAIHIVFVVCSVLLALFFGGWEANAFLQTHARGSLLLSLGSFASAVLLLIYGKAVLKKLKHISYL